MIEVSTLTDIDNLLKEKFMGIFDSKKAQTPVKGEVPPAGSQAEKIQKQQEATKKK